jgi:cytoskeleton protein RodZ
MAGEGYQHIGALLRQAREERHLSLEDVARRMHIRLRYLQALEEGRISDLPGLPYAKGYLQAYAQYLGLDRVEIMRRFERMEGLITRKGFFLPQVFSKDKKASPGAIWWGLTLAVMMYAVWAALLAPERSNPSLVESFAENPQETVRITPDLVRKTPCLQPPEALYPPCHVSTSAAYVFPLRRHYDNVMQWSGMFHE